MHLCSCVFQIYYISSSGLSKSLLFASFEENRVKLNDLFPIFVFLNSFYFAFLEVVFLGQFVIQIFYVDPSV